LDPSRTRSAVPLKEGFELCVAAGRSPASPTPTRMCAGLRLLTWRMFDPRSSPSARFPWLIQHSFGDRTAHIKFTQLCSRQFPQRVPSAWETPRGWTCAFLVLSGRRQLRAACRLTCEPPVCSWRRRHFHIAAAKRGRPTLDLLCDVVREVLSFRLLRMPNRFADCLARFREWLSINRRFVVNAMPSGARIALHQRRSVGICAAFFRGCEPPRCCSGANACVERNRGPKCW
jgi:hypothetical protein